MFSDWEHKFALRELVYAYRVLMFAVREHKFSSNKKIFSLSDSEMSATAPSKINGQQSDDIYYTMDHQTTIGARLSFTTKAAGNMHHKDMQLMESCMGIIPVGFFLK